MTIFSIQHFLEDHFERRGLVDIDQYAVRIANTFERLGASATDKALARELSRVRTAFFRRNHDLNRKEFELSLSETLHRRFKKKRLTQSLESSKARLLPAEDDFMHGADPLRAS